MSDYPPPLPVRHMTRWDFYGVLFVKFPIERQDWTWKRARRELERLIRRNGDTEITPATIYSAFFAERLRRLENLPAFAVEKMAQAAWKERAERRRTANREKFEKLIAAAKAGATPTNPTKTQENTEWSF